MSSDPNGTDPDPLSSRPKPRCKLIGRDGNVFAVISTVRATLIDAGQQADAKEFVQRAFKARSYHEVLSLCLHYVDVH